MQAGHLRSPPRPRTARSFFCSSTTGSDIDYLFIDMNERIDRAMGGMLFSLLAIVAPLFLT